MTESEARTQLSRLFCGSSSLIERAGIHARDRQGIVRIWTLLVDLHGPEGCVDAFTKVRCFAVAPPVRDNSRANPAEPGVRLGQVRITLAGFSKKLARPQVGYAHDLMEKPRALVNEVP